MPSLLGVCHRVASQDKVSGSWELSPRGLDCASWTGPGGTLLELNYLHHSCGGPGCGGGEEASPRRFAPACWEATLEASRPQGSCETIDCGVECCEPAFAYGGQGEAEAEEEEVFVLRHAAIPKAALLDPPKRDEFGLDLLNAPLEPVCVMALRRSRIKKNLERYQQAVDDVLAGSEVTTCWDLRDPSRDLPEEVSALAVQGAMPQTPPSDAEERGIDEWSLGEEDPVEHASRMPQPHPVVAL